MPLVVFAKEDVTIKDLVLKKTTGYAEVLNDAEIINNKIVLDLKMYEVGDSAEYQFMVKNNTSKDYQLDSSNLINSNNTVEYQIISEDKSSLVEKNSSKKFKLIVTYKNEVDKTLFKAGKYDSSSKLIYELKEHHLINPETGSFFLTILFIILFVTIGFMKLNNNKIRTYLFLSLFLIPFSVFALEEYRIELESNIIIGYVKPNPCTYDGELVQGAEYTNGQYTYRYMQESKYNNSTRIYEWQNIENDGWGVRLSDSSSTDPVTTILCTSINDKPIVSMRYMFYNSKTTSINTSSFNTSNVTNMEVLFYGCSSLTEIDVTNFDTSNVTNMQAMFFGCSSLTELDLSGFDLRGAASFSAIASGIFSETSSLKKLNLSNMKLPADMSNAIFRSSSTSLSPIEEIDVTGWDLSNTTNANGMLGAYNTDATNFNLGLGGNGLKIIKGLDTWDTSHITSMLQMFQCLSSLTTLDVSNFDTSNVTNMSWMFKDCSSLLDIDVSNFDTSNVTLIDAMFYNCSSLTELDLSTFNTSNVTTMQSMSGSCSSLKELNLSGFDFSNYNPGSLMMNVSGGGFSSLKVLNMTGAKLPSNLNYAFGGLRTVEQIILDDVDTSLATTMLSMFNGSSKLTLLNLSSFDTFNVTDMTAMFIGCSSLLNIDVTNFDTINVTNMQAMFQGCTSLTELDLSSFDTSNVTNMKYMFQDCSNLITLDLSGFDLRGGSSFNSIAGSIFKGTTSLKKLNLSNMKLPVDMSHSIFRNSTPNNSPIEEINVTGWDLSNTTNAYGMFASNGSNGTGGSGLKKIVGLDTMDTSHITNMSQMFYGLSSLTTLDLSNFDTSIVTNMSEMFGGCSSLTDLNISAFNTSNVTSMNSMFSNCRGLDELDLSGFDLSGVSLSSTFTNNIFSGTTSLKKLNLSNMKLPVDMSNAIFRYSGANSSPIEEIDVTGWDLSNTTKAASLFAAYGSNGLGGTGLKRIIGLDTWNTSHITNMSQMFQGLSSLTTLDLSSFNTSNVTNTDNMFNGCTSLSTGYARTQADADKFNNSSNKPSGITFAVKS